MNAPLVDAYLDELLNHVSAAENPVLPAEVYGGAGAAAPAPPAPAPPVSAPPVSTTVPAPAPERSRAATPCDTDRAPPTQAMSASSRWLRIGIGADHYAFELLRVQEVVRVAPVLAMRGAGAAVLGVMNLRGRVVPVFDLGRWLDGRGVDADQDSRIVVVERDDQLIGVLVTRVEDVTTIGREHVEPPVTDGAPGAIVGIARVGRTPTVLLDANALFD